MLIRIFLTRVDRIDTEAVYARCSLTRRERADTYRCDDRRRSLAATAMLEEALRSAGVSEREMRYSRGENGKPLLANCPDLHVCLSHSGNYAVCAIADRPVGVDVEMPRTVGEPVLRRYFTEAERTAAEPLRLWTLKEAFCKMTGKGLAGLGEARLLFGERVSVADVPAQFYEWILDDGTRIALCVEGNTTEIPEMVE